jgi:RNA recognition motif-containing protein
LHQALSVQTVSAQHPRAPIDQASAAMADCKVYVGNIDWKITQQELKSHMASAGEVVVAEIFEQADGRSKGAGIVEYATAEAAESAVATLNDSNLGERPIFVREDRGSSKGKGKDKDKDKGKGKGKDREKGKGKGKGKRSDPADEGRLLYVGNLPFRTSWQDVKDVFKECGSVIRVDIAEGPDGRSKGYATVLYETEGEANGAIDKLNGTDFQGRSLTVRMETFG